MKKINIAIDGYSSCGKSTLAKELARRLGYAYIDSGAMYRAVTLYAMRNGMANSEIDKEGLINSLPEIQIDFKHNTETGQSETHLNGENVEHEIRGMEVSGLVSKVAIIKEIRAKLVEIQHSIGQKKGVVMDGRDIGTVVLPHAELKIFMTASEEVRAQRRFSEMQEKGIEITLEEVRANLQDRDHKDTTREENPLKKADDALVLDNSNLTMQQQNDLAHGWALERIN